MFALLRVRDFGLLWLAGLISIAGDLALVVALPLHVYRLTDSTLATAGVLAANFLPRVLLGSVAGVFVDRWDRRTVMVVADLIRAPPSRTVCWSSRRSRSSRGRQIIRRRRW